jgi:hypothetical protein
VEDLQGYLILAAMIAAATAYAIYKGRTNTRRLAGAWDAAATVLENPKTQNEEHRTVLGGRYAGREVWAEFSTTWASDGVRTDMLSGAYATNYTVAVVGERGRAAWSIRPDGSGWRVEANDPAVQAALESSDLLAELPRAPAPPADLRFDRDGTLRFHRSYVPTYYPGMAPSADQFRADLALLSRVADVNRRVNAV